MPSYRDSRLVKVALVAFFILLLGYAYFEARAMLYGPRITISAETITAHEPLITIAGTAEHTTELRMNGAPITVTEDGVFSEPFLLTAGENYIVLDATDRYGRARQKTIEVIYLPSDTPLPAPTPAPATSTEKLAPEAK